MKILIAVPTFENIYPDTFKAIYDLDVSGHDAESLSLFVGMTVQLQETVLRRWLLINELIMC